MKKLTRIYSTHIPALFIFEKKKVNKNTTGICDKHKISYVLKHYPLGCPCCYKNDYLDRGYVLNGFQIPVLEIIP